MAVAGVILLCCCISCLYFIHRTKQQNKNKEIELWMQSQDVRSNIQTFKKNLESPINSNPNDVSYNKLYYECKSSVVNFFLFLFVMI